MLSLAPTISRVVWERILNNNYLYTSNEIKSLNQQRPQGHSSAVQRPQAPVPLPSTTSDSYSPTTTKTIERWALYSQEDPQDLHSNNIQIVEDYHDRYLVTETNKLSFTAEDTCFICCDTLTNSGHLLSTACACKAVVHVRCFNSMVKHAEDCQWKGKKQPSFSHHCGLCSRPFLGKFAEQYTATILAYRRFAEDTAGFTEEETPDWWADVLPPIIFSLEQLVKSIRRDWRSTLEHNYILSHLLENLAYHCNLVRGYTLDQHIHDSAFNQCWYAAIGSLAMHDRVSTSLGVGDIVLNVARTIRANVSDTSMEYRYHGRCFFPAVFGYLLALINNTTVVLDRKDKFTTNQLDCESVSHLDAQDLLVSCLNPLWWDARTGTWRRNALLDHDPGTSDKLAAKLLEFWMQHGRWAAEWSPDAVGHASNVKKDIADTNETIKVDEGMEGVETAGDGGKGEGHVPQQQKDVKITHLSNGMFKYILDNISTRKTNAEARVLLEQVKVHELALQSMYANENIRSNDVLINSKQRIECLELKLNQMWWNSPEARESVKRLTNTLFKPPLTMNSLVQEVTVHVTAHKDVLQHTNTKTTVVSEAYTEGKSMSEIGKLVVSICCPNENGRDTIPHHIDLCALLKKYPSNTSVEVRISIASADQIVGQVKQVGRVGQVVGQVGQTKQTKEVGHESETIGKPIEAQNKTQHSSETATKLLETKVENRTML